MILASAATPWYDSFIRKDGDRMYGAMIGDIVGSKYEFYAQKTKSFPLFSKGCCYTDDTVLTVAVARALGE